MANAPYIVGTRGPELFMPVSKGFVIPAGLFAVLDAYLRSFGGGD